MMNKNKQIIAVMLVGIIALSAFYVFAIEGGADNLLSQKKKVLCTANIGGPLDTAAGVVDDINSVSCRQTGDSCIGLFYITSAKQYSLFYAEGGFIFEAVDDRADGSFKVSRVSGAFAVEKSLCTNSNKVNFKLLDKNNIILNSREVTIQ